MDLLEVESSETEKPSQSGVKLRRSPEVSSQDKEQFCKAGKKGAASCSDLAAIQTTSFVKASTSRSASTSPSLQVRVRKKVKKPTKMRPKSLLVLNNIQGKRSSTVPETGAMSLFDALNDRKMKIGFRKFLESEFSVENLDFWFAAQDYKSIKNKQLRKAKAQDIYEEFVSPGAPNQINLDFYTTQQVVQNMEADTIPNSNLFTGAQKYVYNIMENDSYARFVRSKYYDICSSCGRRSPLKFFQDILYVNSKSRERSPSPSGQRYSGDYLMVSNSNNNAIVIHRSDSNLEKNFNSEETLNGQLYGDDGLSSLSGSKKFAKSDTNLAKCVSETRSIKSFFSRLRSK